MSEPALLVVAGCNGSGKSSFSSLLAPAVPFDYDIHFAGIYESLIEIDIKEEMAHNKAFHELNNQIDTAITTKSNFCYETNFDTDPVHWPDLFAKHGHKLQLIYLCLDSVKTAQQRVAIRVENGGHFVSDEEVNRRYFAGFQNINREFRRFDRIHFFDGTAYKQVPQHILSLSQGALTALSAVPEYIFPLIPDVLRAPVMLP